MELAPSIKKNICKSSESEDEDVDITNYLQNVDKKKKVQQKDTLFGFKSDSSDDDQTNEKNGHNYVEFADKNTWGSKLKAYYNTDFIDQDYSTYNETEEQQALQEEEEAKSIQQQLAKELNKIDFDIYLKSTANLENISEKIQTFTPKSFMSDYLDLSQKQKLKIFENDSPEFKSLVHDFEQNIMEFDVQSSTNKFNNSLLKFELSLVQRKFLFNYITNIAFYLLLKSKRILIKTHPMVNRLYQIRQMLLNLNLKMESNHKPKSSSMAESSRISINQNIELRSDEENICEQKSQFDKRGINYQISKNKGLTPFRKKEMRNPRVKNRNKYLRALISKKGAGPSVRLEKVRYGGEISGIKASVKKGIKIKS